jgi:UDP-N-acetylglucosamine diphosphorylase / glucose-1-phosphate thymidylyltransferase / UDP-N-acetylgalactosamine diphosphorylase / glucosamine-1-phosphate N-acetyltransferase / galactosamine-1-phosphate N-acetyltransferase
VQKQQMKIVLFDPPESKWLYPFSLTRSVADFLLGMLTNRQRWQLIAGAEVSVLCKAYLPSSNAVAANGQSIFVNAAAMADADLWAAIGQLKVGELLQQEEMVIAFCSAEAPEHIDALHLLLAENTFQKIDYKNEYDHLQFPHQLFQWNDRWLRSDFSLVVAQSGAAAPLHSSNQVIGPAKALWLGEGVAAHGVFFNTTNGPVYVDKGAQLQEGVVLRGPIYVGPNCLVKANARIYAASSFGANCILGGEIKNTIFMGNSNKGHDGYLGDSVVGEWCNFGAGSSNSNLKNNLSTVGFWNPFLFRFVEAGQKAGLLMGDYSRCSINTSFNTGTVVGIASNVFCDGLTPKHIPSFCWGANGQKAYELEKALTDIERWQALKNQTMSAAQKHTLLELHQFLQLKEH